MPVALRRIALCGALLALCACDAPAPPLPRRSDAVERPNVLLVTLDTTRADHLGPYGYDRGTTPNLDRLAGESVVYTRAIAPSSWTLPAHASLFTGLTVDRHGARFDEKGPLLLTEAVGGSGDIEEIRARPLARGLVTLAERLRAAGWQTAGFVGGPWMKHIFGLAAGFDHYRDEGVRTLTGESAFRLTDAALDFVDALDGSTPFFVFVNYYDPHGPYVAPLRDRLAVDWRLVDPAEDPPLDLLVAGYDAEIRYVDRELGRLLGRLRARGLYDDTLVVVTADHGELLGEHGQFGHGYYLTEPELHVPLLVKPAGGGPAGVRDATRVSSASIFASILERTGLPIPDGVAAPLERSAGQPVVAETYPHHRFAPEGHWRALYQGSYKFLWNSLGHHELFDLSRDAGEERNLVDEQPALAARLEGQLDHLVADLRRRPSSMAEEDRAIDPKTRQALEGLGYLE